MGVLRNFALLGSLAISQVCSMPLATRQEAQPNLDLDVLQFALTLEHLENVFYKGALSRFNEADFLNAGFDSKFFNQLKFVARDEEAHVVFLTDAITGAGGTPVAACEYNFPYNDVHSFVAVASILEGVGVSAYLGGAPIITDKDILTAAGAVLVAEGLHQSILRDSLHQVSSAKVVGTPVTPNSIFTLASAFIVSCPPENPALPFQAFPILSPQSGGGHEVGATAHFALVGEVAAPETAFLTFVSGLDVVSVPVNGGQLSVAIPPEAQGQTFVFLTNADAAGVFAEAAVVAGPAIIEVNPSPPTIDFGLL